MLKILFALKNSSEAIMDLFKDHKVDVLHEDNFLIKQLGKNSYNIVLLEGDIDVIPDIKASDPRAEIIFFGREKENSIEAIKQGASAYFSFPVEIERLKRTIKDIQDLFVKRRETVELERLLITKYTFAGVVGRNPHMLDVSKGSLHHVNEQSVVHVCVGNTRC